MVADRQNLGQRVGDVVKLMSERKVSLFFLFYLVSGCLLAYGSVVHRLGLVVCAATGILLTFVLAWRKRFWYKVFLPLLGGILLGSMTSLVLFDGYVGRYQAMAETEEVASVQGVVTDVVWTNAWSGQYLLRITGDGLPYTVVVSSAQSAFSPGQVLTGEIRFLPWEEEQDDFNEKRYYLSQGVVSAAEDMGLTDTGETKLTFTGLFSGWNRYLSDRITAHVKNDGLPLAMLLGNREELTDTVKRDFRRLGILHLVAVSGTHFTMLASLVENLLIRFRVHPRYRYGILSVLTVFYMVLTGLTASVLRAGLMFLLALLCRKWEMKVRYFTSLNLSCGLICLFDPFAVLDVGLHLSYLAVCGCILTIYTEAHWHGWLHLWKIKRDKNGKPVKLSRMQKICRSLVKGAASMFVLNLIVTCLTLPLTWLYFGETSILSLVLNLFFIPTTGVLLFLTLLYELLYPLVIPILPMATVLSAFTTILEDTASKLSAIPHVSISLAYPFVPLFLVPLCLGICTLPFQRRKLVGLTVMGLLLCTLFGTVLIYDRVTVDQTYLVYRHDRLREGFVVKSGGEVLLVDVSDGAYSFTGKLLTEAKSLYATELGGYMITHYHNRHVGSFQSLTDDWILRHLYLPTPVTEEEEAVYHSLLAEAHTKGIPVTVFDGETDFHHMQITLAERTWLSRSTHPVTGVVMEAEGVVLAYGSSSFAEGAESIMASLSEADIGILGAHSPVTKKEYTVPFAKKPEVCIWNGDSAAYYVGTTPVAERELFQCRRFGYRFPDANE